MGRSFESVRMGVQEISVRWARAGRAMKKEDQGYALELAQMAKKHSSEAFYALDDPLEAAISPCSLSFSKGETIRVNEKARMLMFKHKKRGSI